ncbi:hypothetical protein Ahy_B03g064328 [Arachis hypogaea]|uniref:Uncharacterized protein n=1 Tax=Arachis hypogaea TaxID=3818 RepID=A0A444ZZC9_ARAHY|nr:hypothetical protein Ahy_B03g064328 [Arachis hypogaea]
MAQRAFELHAQEVTKELENTTRVDFGICSQKLNATLLEVFELHMEELRVKQEEIAKSDNDIKLLEAIIQMLGGKESISTSI